MLNRPEAPLAEIPILPRDERRIVLEQFNDTTMDVPDGLRVHEMFEAQARRTPKATATVDDKQALTYERLDSRANRLAGKLHSLAVGPGVLVGVCLHRSVDMLAAVLGVLKSGGAYVPLDPGFPRQRLAMMLEDAAPRVIVTQRDLARGLPESAATVICIEDVLAASAAADEPDEPTPGKPSDAAYVIFTSGSTGRPKGVVIEHRSVVNFLTSMAQAPGMTASDRLVAVTTLSFDIAALELFLPLTVGACVVIATAEQAADPVRLRQLLQDSDATVMQATPATWRMLLESGWMGGRSLRIYCGGEALSRDLADRLLTVSDVVWNLYGPTETTIWSSVQRIAASDGPVSIGRAIANTRMYVLDRHCQPVPIGVTGELYIGGAGVARGYLGRADLTAERFVVDEFAGQPGGRMYRTGDLARYHDDGTIECLGRVDHQAKVRGFRVELGEIEAALVKCAGIQQAVVVDRHDGTGDSRLVAYYVATEGASPADEDLRRDLHETLPGYMVPSAFVRLDALPLTPNGKVDRRALPAPGAGRGSVGRQYVAPRDPQERQLSQIWSTLLGRSPVGATDNFFEMGGHSLLATRLISQISETFGVALPIRAVFDSPTLEGLARRVREASTTEDASASIAAEVEEGQI